MNTLKKLYGLIECCLNWRVIVGLAVVGVGLFVFAPKSVASSLPVLVALVCPISMLVMLFSMGRMKMQASNNEASEPASVSLDLDRKQLLLLLEERLERVQVQRREIANQLAVLERPPARTLGAGVAASDGPVPMNTDQEQQQLQLLEERLEQVQVQRREIANQLAALDRPQARTLAGVVVGRNGTADHQATVP